MIELDPGLPATWRPQGFGRRAARHIDDPLVEPLWTGFRVLAHLASGEVHFLDGVGATVENRRVADALIAATRAEAAILDGYLTDEAARTGEGIYSGSLANAPSASQFARQMIVGGGRDRRRELTETLDEAALGRTASPDELVFVAVDLVALDGIPLLDVPLLERKRLLESAIEPADLVRIGIHVRPPIDTWISTWRALGFRGIAYKGSNSRYRPGEANDEWATAPLPPR